MNTKLANENTGVLSLRTPNACRWTSVLLRCVGGFVLSMLVAVFTPLPLIDEVNASSHVGSPNFCLGHGMVVSREGHSRKKGTAEKRARRKWRERVRWLMPWSWGQADWSKAQMRDYDCRKKGRRWYCRAKAVPCACANPPSCHPN